MAAYQPGTHDVLFIATGVTYLSSSTSSTVTFRLAWENSYLLGAVEIEDAVFRHDIRKELCSLKLCSDSKLAIPRYQQVATTS